MNTKGEELDMHGHGGRPDAPDRTQPPDVPPYLVWFAIPPYVAVFVIAGIEPMAGVALLTPLTITVIALHVLIRITR